MKPDYSQWLTGGRLLQEEKLWGDPEHATWPHFVRGIEQAQRVTRVDSIIEFGCGTGWVPLALPLELEYVGVDASEECIALAQQKNPGRRFDVLDIRQTPAIFDVEEPFDVSCAFSFLKHFELSEWDNVLALVVQAGWWSVFTVPLADHDYDDGVEFPHVHVTEERLRRAVEVAGREISAMELLPWGETMVWTKTTSDDGRS